MKPSRLALVAVLSLFSTTSFAKDLSCWNLYAKRGEKPLVTASFSGPHKLSDIEVNMPEDQGDIDLKDLEQAAKGDMLTDSRSPYQGGQEFLLAGKGVRLILPYKLTAEGLEESHFEAGNLPKDLMVRQNGVLDIAGSRVSQEQGGDSYFRMHCTAK